MLVYTSIGILLCIGIMFLALSLYSRKQPELGLVNGQLRACPAAPNCVCSEWQDVNAFIAPLTYTTMSDDAWRGIRQTIIDSGGSILLEQDGYLHARFETPIMRYIDDVELRIDKNKQLIHIRSASRVGYSDMGANRMRVTRLREAFQNKYSAKTENH